MAVFFGQADACIAADFAFGTLAKLNPQIENQLAILESSPEFIETVSLYRKNLDESIKNSITDAMCSMDDTIEGKQVRILFMIDGMVPADESDIKPFRLLLEEYERLKSAYAIPGYNAKQAAK